MCKCKPYNATPSTLSAPSHSPPTRHILSRFLPVQCCGSPGTAFSFCCALCEFDLHVDCAMLPRKMKHEAHAHELSLGYASLLHQEALPHPCDICHKVLDYKLWTYNCTDCNFHVHTSCAIKKIRQETYQAADSNFASEPAMGHHGFHYEEPAMSSGRQSKTRIDLFNQQLEQVNDSINTLGLVGCQNLSTYYRTKPEAFLRPPKTRTDVYTHQLVRIHGSTNTLGFIG